MIRSGNPVLKANTFTSVGSSSNSMTIQGTVNKTGILLFLVLLSASWVWGRFFTSGIQSISALMMVGIVASIGLAIFSVFNKSKMHIVAPMYALAQGLAMGGISAMAEASYPGIVLQAVGLTFAVLFSLLGAYKSGMIKPTENFKLGVTAATGGIFIFYMISFVASFFGINLVSVQNASMFSIGISFFVVVIAALNLVMDFDFIEQGEAQSAPKYMEWYGAFGLMVTLLWLYMEILRLLMKLASRRD